jgi:hypothetical protein
VSVVLRAPVIAVKALLVAVGVVLWLAIVPLVDLVRTAITRLMRSTRDS